jgi:enoyl-CoA hydratase/carnithine racemase
MPKIDTYKSAFARAKLTRSPDGVLEVVLHTDGDTLVFDGHTHEEFVDLFHQIGQDADNRVVILTGARKAFIDRIDPAGFDFFTRGGMTRSTGNGRKFLRTCSIFQCR